MFMFPQIPDKTSITTTNNNSLIKTINGFKSTVLNPIILDDQQKYQVFVAKLSQLLLRLILRLVYIENIYDGCRLFEMGNHINIIIELRGFRIRG